MLKISIPAFREEGDRHAVVVVDCAGLISIPAFREEGDSHLVVADDSGKQISIPAFREEGDGRKGGNKGVVTNFNPRLP